MLRVETDDGWWLITHPDHARLAAAFASHWGNALFVPPAPRAEVLHGIAVHDDGWAARDTRPALTREGKPSAFSHDLVGRYSAFEEIDLADYLTVRESAVSKVEAESAYAALLVSMHTSNLLTERADRSTIAIAQLPLLDTFLEQQLARQARLRARINHDPRFSIEDTSESSLLQNFRLLQATDNLSLLSCVCSTHPATLLHALATHSGPAQKVDVLPLARRTFRLAPYPFDQSSLRFELPARHMKQHTFADEEELQDAFQAAPAESLQVIVTA